MSQKPKLVPVKVPWMISSVPRFQTWKSDDGLLTAIAFIAFFKLETAKYPITTDSGVFIVENTPDFVPSKTSEGAPYRLVRVLFDRPAYSAMDERDFPEGDFDWSELPIDNKNYNSVQEYVAATTRYLVETLVDPNPAVYELKYSPLLEKLALSPQEYKHIILVGNDQFFDVVAKDWKWEPGQAVD
jgi:hypothetical protein